jgi:two-component system phosphate regulon sensor histidine kinase PhoR
MYSLKYQLLFSSVIAAIGGMIAGLYFSRSIILTLLIVVLSVGISYGILMLFVYRPIRRYHNVVQSQLQKEPIQRVIIESSDEFLHLSDSLNTMLESFRKDIIRMKKLESVRTEFLANVSHELRTPIFTTQGLIETLLNGAIDDKKVNRDFLRKALANTERLNTLLGELIDISRIESGELKLRFRFFDVISFLRETVNEMQTAAEQREVSLRLEGDTTLSIDVYGDKERLHQVLVNLINNAVKYSEPKDSVAVSFNDQRDFVEISVRDTGIGIAPQHLPRIFERFYRVDRDRSREVGGTGLGLAIAKHIVEAHEAEFKVVSEVGVGSTFTFWVHKQP